MTRKTEQPHLSHEQQQKICLYLSAGCDRETAAKLTNCSHWDIHSAMLSDAAFAAEVRHAEGAGELTHVRNVQNASQDVKNWRASVWWLERRSPERYGKRDASTVTTRQLKAFVAQLVSLVTEEIQDLNARRRLVDRFDELVRSLDRLIFEEPSMPNIVVAKGANNLTDGTAELDSGDIEDDAYDPDQELE